MAPEIVSTSWESEISPGFEESGRLRSEKDGSDGSSENRLQKIKIKATK